MSENNVPAIIEPDENEQSMELAKSRIGQEITDSETGDVIQLSESDFSEFVTAQQEMHTGALNAALGKIQFSRGLHKIQTKKLYLFVAESFTDYATNHLKMSRTQAYNFTRLAERFAQSPAFDKIMALPVSTALELARDMDFVDQVNEDNSAVVDKILESKLGDLKEKLKNQKDKAADLQNKISVDRDTYNQRERDYENKITSLEKTIDAMAGERGLDPERLKKIANKNDLMHSIQDSELKINAIMGKLQDAAEIDELRDAEVGIMVNRFLGVMENWIHSVHDAYADVLFNLSQRNQPLVSETENDSNVPD